jgi:ATP-binding cassette subfamily B protein
MATVLRWPMESIGFLFSFLLDARTASDRIFEVFDEENTITDPAAPVDARSRGALAFEGVHFRYQDATASERDLLDGIDLTLEPGETMALVGLTGSGKTTLTTLPARLYDVTGGGDDRRRRRARPDPARAAHPRRHGLRGLDALLPDGARERAAGREDLAPGSAQAERCCAKRSPSRRPASSTSLPTASTRSSAKRGSLGGQRQRLALARASRRAPPCSCSTTRCRRSTSTPRRSSKTRCAR